VANHGDDTVSVIDGKTNTVTATIPVGQYPSAVSVNPSTNIIYVANHGDNTVSVIDGKTNTLKPIK
jgi:YVTN family beta-propeller protein